MTQLDAAKFRHELAALKAALGTAKGLLHSAPADDRLAELVMLAEAKARALVTQLDLAIDNEPSERGA